MDKPSRMQIRNNVIAGLIVAALLSIASFIFGLMGWLASFIGRLYDFLIQTVEISLWILLILIFSSIALVVKAVLNWFCLKSTEVCDYKNDIFFGIVWRWQYSNGKPIGIWCFCPSCDTALVYEENIYLPRTKFHCDHCNQLLHEVQGDKEYALGQVQRQIERNLRNRSLNKSTD